MRSLFSIIVGAALCGSLFSCAGTVANGGKVVQAGKTEGHVRKDLYIKVDATSSELGTVVVPYKETAYKILIASLNKMDSIFVESCHRHQVFNDKSIAYGGKDGGYSFSFDYIFNAEAEKKDCPLNITTLEKDGQRIGRAMAAFRNPAYDLPADLRCNGEKFNVQGVGLCQGKLGKIQEIHFAQAVKFFSKDVKCPVPGTGEGKDFTFPIPAETCNFIISTAVKPWKTGSLTVLPYTEEEYEGEF